MKVYLSNGNVYDNVSKIEGSPSTELVIHFAQDYDPVIVWADDLDYIED